MLGKMRRHKISREEKRAILAEFTQLPESYVIFPSLTVAKESRAHKRRNYAIYELLFSF